VVLDDRPGDRYRMTTAYIATTGGHLTQLTELAQRIPPDPEAIWVTHANPQSTSLLAGRDVEYIPYVGARDIPGVLRSLVRAHALYRRSRPQRAVSTGSGIALGYLPYLAARGVECHYIESAARVGGPSLTGRILRWVPRVRTYTQYRHWSGPHWRYGGSGFDAYEPAPGGAPFGERIRVVVTVGTAMEFPFARLMRALAPLLEPGGDLERVTGLPVDVLWQTGCTPTDGLPLTATPFLPAADLVAALAEADIVVSHAGTGSVLANLAAGRFAVVVSRRAEFGEAVDDHQQELAEELVERGLAIHRDPEKITVDDLLDTRQHAVRRVPHVPPFVLR
jgi:UDP-N-acetylglucosamine--N-acetylmuramyl-(pentapeptide) pyrophosphoryl-undecaprenol N-acetylglucosamine transferase